MVTVVLKDSVQDLEGFTVERFNNGTAAIYGEFKGVMIKQRMGFLEFGLSYLTDLFPKELRPYVLRIQAIECVSFKALTNRTFGEYKHKSANATLDANSSGYVIHLFGTRLEDMEELYRLIRSGRISPEVSWHGPQKKQLARRPRRRIVTPSF